MNDSQSAGAFQECRFCHSARYICLLKHRCLGWCICEWVVTTARPKYSLSLQVCPQPAEPQELVPPGAALEQRNTNLPFSIKHARQQVVAPWSLRTLTTDLRARTMWRIGCDRTAPPQHPHLSVLVACPSVCSCGCAGLDRGPHAAARAARWRCRNRLPGVWRGRW